MFSALHPPQTIYQVWKNLPEGTLAEIIRNKLSIRPSHTDSHQVVLNSNNFRLYNFLGRSKLGKMRIAVYDVHFSNQNIFQPDIIFIANENLKKIKSKGLVGAPDLVIEILSPATAQKDLGEKKDVYEQYGVKEYYTVDPASKIVRSFILKGKQFVEQPKSIAVIHSPMLKLKINF